MKNQKTKILILLSVIHHSSESRYKLNIILTQNRKQKQIVIPVVLATFRRPRRNAVNNFPDMLYFFAPPVIEITSDGF